MENKKRILVLRDTKGEIWGRYLQFESIKDLYIYIGKLANESYQQIKITFLQYYNFDFDNFAEFCEVLGEKARLCTFLLGKKEYNIYFEYIN